MGRHLSDYRSARRNALRGGFYRDAEGRKLYQPSTWPKRSRGTHSTVSQRLYDRIMSGWHRLNRKRQEHAHARATARQGRNNPTCAVLTDAELDAATAALA